jgi:hypothetical protein
MRHSTREPPRARRPPARLGGKAQIALKDYVRLTYAVVIEAKKMRGLSEHWK